MKIGTLAVAAAGILLVAPCGHAQTPVITSFQGNGELTWTNGVNTDALYRVEWAAQAGGPWCQTFQAVHTLDAHSNTSFRVSVPMFYRVVMVTNPPPAGMVLVDGGEFEMGQEGIATPVHTNFIGPFTMDDTEVTKAKWDEISIWATNHGYRFESTGLGKTNSHPVHSVNWYDCAKWCNARSEKEGLDPSYYRDAGYATVYRTGRVDVANDWVKWTNGGYRLPTEAEWEKAARGGRQQRLFPHGGDTISHSQANYYSSTSYVYDVSSTRGYPPAYNDGVQPLTSPAGSFPANGYGLHDMAGNLWEWAWDWHDVYSPTSQTNPRGPPSGTNRVVRGGCWFSYAPGVRCANRSHYGQDLAGIYVGFRCVRSEE